MEATTDKTTLHHEWRRDEDGDVDIFAVSQDIHNGPVCVRCGEGYCHHCEPDCYRYVCPEAVEEK